MIVQGTHIVEVGKRYMFIIWDKDLNEHRHVPVLVLKVATVDDWFNFCEEEGVLDIAKSNPNHGPNYYEISVD